jgi:hypothetical protein
VDSETFIVIFALCHFGSPALGQSDIKEVVADFVENRERFSDSGRRAFTALDGVVSRGKITMRLNRLGNGTLTAGSP